MQTVSIRAGMAGEEAVRALLLSSLDGAYRLATCILRDPAAAEDAVQEAALRAWSMRRGLRDPDRAEAWFARIVVNVCRAELGAARAGASPSWPSPSPRPTIPETLRDEVGRALARLTADEQIVVAMRYGRDLTVPQIAAATGLREGTVKSRLHNAEAHLRAAFEAERRAEEAGAMSDPGRRAASLVLPIDPGRRAGRSRGPCGARLRHRDGGPADRPALAAGLRDGRARRARRGRGRAGPDLRQRQPDSRHDALSVGRAVGRSVGDPVRLTGADPHRRRRDAGRPSPSPTATGTPAATPTESQWPAATPIKSTGNIVPVGSMTPFLSGPAVNLQNATVLVAGGMIVTADGVRIKSNLAEIYNMGTHTFTPTGSMADARYGHTATLLTDGRVLVVGGADLMDGIDNLATAEIYDPYTGVWTRTGSMAQGRASHTATLLLDGRVLITGGFGGGTLPSPRPRSTTRPPAGSRPPAR